MNSSLSLQATSILHPSLYIHNISLSPAITHPFSKSDGTERICVVFTGFYNCLLVEGGGWSAISTPFSRGNYQNSEHSLLAGLETLS